MRTMRCFTCVRKFTLSWVTDRRTNRHRLPAQAALVYSIARQKWEPMSSATLQDSSGHGPYSSYKPLAVLYLVHW